jgi:hypothetical protein
MSSWTDGFSVNKLMSKAIDSAVRVYNVILVTKKTRTQFSALQPFLQRI